MGAKRKTNGTVAFFRIFNGIIIRAVNKETNHSKVYKNSKDKEFLAEPFDSISGMLQKVYVFTENWENKEIEKLCIQLRDTETGELLCLTELLQSDSASSLIQRLSACDLSEEIEICAMLKDKQYNYAYIKQNGVTVKSPFTKDNPLPQWKKVKINNQDIWDKTDAINRLKEIVEERKKTLELVNNSKNGNSANLKTDTEVQDQQNSDSDLPF